MSAIRLDRLPPPVFFIVAVVLMVALDRFLPLSHLPGLHPVAAATLAAAGLGFGLWGAWMFRRHATPIRPFRPAAAMISGGPYRYTRNPLYLALLVMLAALALLLGSLTPFAVPPLFAWVITRRFIRAEETMLEQRFGDDYRAYARRTRRWL